MWAQHSSSCSHRLCHHGGEPGEMTVLWHCSRVPILGYHRRCLWGDCKIPFLPPSYYRWHQHPCMHTPVSITVSVLLFHTCCLAGRTKLLMELHLWAQICREEINITRLPRRASTPLKAIPKGLWAAGEIIHAAATWNYQQRSGTACPVLTQYGWLCLKAMQQTL